MQQSNEQPMLEAIDHFALGQASYTTVAPKIVADDAGQFATVFKPQF